MIAIAVAGACNRYCSAGLAYGLFFSSVIDRECFWFKRTMPKKIELGKIVQITGHDLKMLGIMPTAFLRRLASGISNTRVSATVH
jgi:hypothetical protein